MSKSYLRRKLSRLFKQHGYGKLFTCSRFAAYKMLSSEKMRSMINFLSIKPGDKNYDYSTNQVVKKTPQIEFGYHYSRSVNRLLNGKNRLIGLCASQADSVEYESGYCACGCGHWACYSAPLKSKEEIVNNMKESLNDSDFSSNLAKHYFACLEKGIDILTEDGFLVPGWDKYFTDKSIYPDKV